MKDCKQHTCDLICHDGDCEPCSEIISKTCKTCNKSFDTPCGSEIDCFVCNKEELLKLVKSEIREVWSDLWILGALAAVGY